MAKRVEPAYLASDVLPGHEELIIGFCESYPHHVDDVRRLVLLADSIEFRTRIAAEIDSRVLHGTWAPIRVNGAKPVGRQTQRKIQFEVCEFELLLKCWQLLLDDLNDARTHFRVARCRSALDLVRLFRRKIEDTLKAIAKRQPHFASFEHDEEVEDKHSGNIIYLPDGRSADSPDQLDDALDARTFAQKAKRFIDRQMPAMSGQLRALLAGEGHASASDPAQSRRERDKLLRYLRLNRDVILRERLQ